MFGAIYKVLPDRNLEWRDVGVGAVVTAALFTLGKSLIGWYIGTSAVASSCGAASGLLVMLLWVYYSPRSFCWAPNSRAPIQFGMAATATSSPTLWQSAGELPLWGN